MYMSNDLMHQHVHEHVHEIHASSWTSHHKTAGAVQTRATIRSISGAAPFCQQHLSATSASNICQASIVCQQHLSASVSICQHLSASVSICQHLPVTSAQASDIWTIYAAMARNSQHLNSQHLNGPSIWASISSISASICQHLAGSPMCCALCASIPSIGACVYGVRS
jgi:hypothetical protein